MRPLEQVLADVARQRRRERVVAVLFCAALVLFVGGSLVWFVAESSRCEREGGTFAKTYDGLPRYECVDPR